MKFTEQSRNSVGTLDEAFVKVDDTFSTTFEKFKSTVNATLVELEPPYFGIEHVQELIGYINDNGDKFIETFQKLTISLIDIGVWIADNGEAIMTVFKGLFVGKLVQNFAKFLVALGPILISFRNTAVSAFTAVTASANQSTTAIQNSATAAGASAGAAASAGFGAKLASGLKGLARNAGLIGVAISLGTVLAEAAGAQIQKLRDKMAGRDPEREKFEREENRKRAKERQEALATAEGFKSEEERKTAEEAVEVGAKIQIIPQLEKDASDDDVAEEIAESSEASRQI